MYFTSLRFLFYLNLAALKFLYTIECQDALFLASAKLIGLFYVDNSTFYIANVL